MGKTTKIKFFVVIKYIEDNDGILLTTEKEYKNNKTKLRIKCNKDGNIWEQTYNHISRGHWCPQCAGLKRKTKEDCIEKAYENGGFCLGEYINNHTKILWKCGECNNEWMAKPLKIFAGQWCSVCAGCKKKTIEDCHELAKNNNGKCLEKEYVNNHTDMLWKCNNCLYEWKINYNYILQGTWCQNCSTKTKTQKKIFDILKGLKLDSNIRQGYWGFDWLRNINKMEIDIWLPKLKLAIEYDGEQHFMPVQFGGMSFERAEINLKYNIERDKLKNELINNHPKEINHFIRFNYLEDITEEYIIEKLKNNGINI